jgi:hypothetical protein
MHFDPRDYDSRDDLRSPERDSRDRDGDGRDLGRGPGDSSFDSRHSREDERWPERDAWVERVVLDHELKREYQSWLHERDRDRDDYDGHPDRTDDEIREWAHEHDLPYFDDEVHFPDLRIEYRDRDGWEDHQDIEVVTSHYRGAHAASVARSGFSRYRRVSLRITAHSGSRGGSGRHRGPIEELFD